MSAGADDQVVNVRVDVAVPASHDTREIRRQLRAGLEDPWVVALVRILGALRGLDDDAQRRVLQFVLDRNASQLRSASARRRATCIRHGCEEPRDVWSFLCAAHRKTLCLRCGADVAVGGRCSACGKDHPIGQVGPNQPQEKRKP